MVVKDRNDDDRIVACVQRHGKYLWDMINGNSWYLCKKGQFIVRQYQKRENLQEIDY